MAEITILDGGLSRELTRFGAKLTQPDWSAGALMRHPEAVKRAHQAFFDAGATIATTASYAVVPFHLGPNVFAARGAELATLSGKLAREAAGDRRVAGCLPPACGSYIPDAFDANAAREILSVLVTALAPFSDLWLAETMSSLEEMRVTAEAIAGQDQPLWIACSLRDDRLDAPPALRSGEPVEAAARLAADLGAEALLFNCSLPEVMEAAVIAARDTLAQIDRPLPLGVYANGFDPAPREGGANETLSPMRPDLDPPTYVAWADRWVLAGATLIGGCCGIGSDHIAALDRHFSADPLTP